MATPHDDLFRFTFHHVRHAAAWLGSFVPRHIRDAIDWESLQPAPESVQDELLHARMADLVFHAQRTVTRSPLWLLAEHKSHRDAAVDDQLLRYAVRLRNKGPRPDDRPPIAVLTITATAKQPPSTQPARTLIAVAVSFHMVVSLSPSLMRPLS